jgi:ABC-type transport system substrate-binding protein
MYKKFLALALSVLMLLTVVNAGAENAAPINVNIQIGADVGSMAPWASDGGGRMLIMPEIYETLFYQRTFGGEAIPLLATGYTALGNNVYQITIHDDIYDTAGNHITAADVEYSYKQDIAEGNQASYVGNIGDIKAIDDYTVEITLTSNGLGVMEDAFCGIRIVSQKQYETDSMGSVPVGTGPYVLKDWAVGSSVVLEKNPNYWNADDRAEVAQANCDTITYKVISEPAQILISMETGDIDYTASISTADIHHFLEGGDDADKFNLMYYPASLSQCLFFNCDESNPFSDVRLRQAICYAIDNQGCLDGAYDGLGNVCHAFASEKSPDYVEAWKTQPYYEYDPAKAQELINEAGYSGGMKIRLLCDALPQHIMLAEIIQMYLAEVGIEVEINSYDDALFNTYRYDKTQWDLHINNKAGAYVVQQWTYSLDANFFGGSTCNWLVDDKWQKLYETALSTDTHSEETVDAAWQYLKEINPVYGICFSYNYFVSAKGMENLYLTDKDNIMPGACTYTDEFISK